MVMRRGSRVWLVGGVCGALAACNVSEAPVTTGGVPVEGGSTLVGDGGAAFCPAGVVVIDSDFVSTNVSVLSPAGAILSPSIVSSGSAPPGITTALSGDVVTPLEPTPGEIVLIDRTNAVLTWVDPASAAVVRQVPVGTGFAANPQDYVSLAANKAYVSRYETNQTPGQQANDGGGDLLVIDPTAGTVTGRVPFAADGVFEPRPARMLHLGSTVWVSLERFDADFKTAGDAQLVGVSSADDSIAWTLDLPGVADCGGMDVSPSGGIVALSCAGLSSDATPEQRSAIVLVDATKSPPVELKRIPAAVQLGAQLGFTISFATEATLVGTTLGDGASHDDLAFTADVASATATQLLDSGASFDLGDVRCSPGCSGLCFLADASVKALQVWQISSGGLVAQPQAPVDPMPNLPPQGLGAY